MIRQVLLAVLVAAVLVWPVQPVAQVATLIADSVAFDGQSTVVAEGNVEVLYEGQRLLADRIVYDQSTDELEIDGDITLIEEDGQVLIADSAKITGDLRQGIMQGARVVLNEQMQIAAAEINRVDGRYNQLYKAVASSCRVCEDDPTPLWQIRAKRIVHDQEERQLYFDDARFEVMGMPVMYFPRLRLPDPTLKRATGFLIPRIKTTSALGTGLKFPYFITLGDHADLLLTPYLSTDTRTLESRFRRAFTWGDVELNGAISQDDLRPGDTRAYLFGTGRVNLPKDFKLNIDLELVSDESYLLTYDYSDKDRLSSGVELTRTRRNEYISASVEQLRTLRAEEIPVDETLATLHGAATYERRFFPAAIGGELRLVADLQGYERKADAVNATLLAACASVTPPVPAADCIARDVARAGIGLGWTRDWTLRNGMVAKVEGEAAADFYVIGQDSTFSSTQSRVTPAAAVELRWPLARETPGGARQVLEPVVQVAWSESYGDAVPNEDSRLVEFDEGNLLSLSRFSGEDAREEGLRATVGLSWSHLDPSGREYALTAGRVFRADDQGQFTGASGLDGATSDWLVSGRVRLSDRLSLMNRSLFDDQFDFAKSETRLVWSSKRFAASTSYIWIDAEPAEGRTEDVSEWNMDASYRINRHWTGKFDWRYDVTAGSAAEAGVGLEYNNECLSVDLSVSRRFTSSTTVAPTTDVGLRVSLNGFGQDGRPYARNCRHVKG
ncbi:MAG: LPS assembly protein LptD [Rhodobacter sp.]|nr:LPS assembly protein LptD [Rhodobacter sp.]